MSNNDAGSDRAHPTEDAGAAKVERPGLGVDQVRPGDKQGDAAQQHQDPYNTWRLCIEVAALVIVGCGTGAAWLTLNAIRDSVSAMNVQIEDQREALWLDQRPWLSVSSVEIVGAVEVGGQPTFRVTFVNTGKTPASNVRMRDSDRLTRTLRKNEISDWKVPDDFFDSIPYSSYVAFPNATLHQDIKWPFPLKEEVVAKYTRSEQDFTVWSRIEYCSADLSFHWTLIGVSKTYDEDELLIRHSSASAHPGVADHPDCQPASGEQ